MKLLESERKLILAAMPERPAWKLPTIEWKVALNSSLKEGVEAAEKARLREWDMAEKTELGEQSMRFTLGSNLSS